MLSFFKAPGRLRWSLNAVALAASFMAANSPVFANGHGRSLNSYYLGRATERIEVPVVLHKSETVQTEFPYGDALVGDPEIADVVPLTNQSIYILGKKVGVTRLSLLDARKQVPEWWTSKSPMISTFCAAGCKATRTSRKSMSRPSTKGAAYRRCARCRGVATGSDACRATRAQRCHQWHDGGLASAGHAGSSLRRSRSRSESWDRCAMGGCREDRSDHQQCKHTFRRHLRDGRR